ncbi:MAG: MarR family winged helix-turn-helix transcriptional regulator [Bacteroidota bacterium]
MKIEQQIKTSSQLPPSRRLLISLLYTANLINDQIGEALKPFDISIPQFNVLRILRGQKGKPANLSTIQDRMVSKMSNTTRLVDKLILKELVERVICEKNRRKVEISITQKGMNLLTRIDPVVDSAEKAITNNLSTDEMEKMTELLQQLHYSEED